MKHLRNSKNILAIVAICTALAVAFVVLIQAQSDDTEDDGCRWHLQDQKHVTNGYTVTSNVGINALFWNDCTGDLYHLYREGTDLVDESRKEDWDERIESRKIDF